MSTSQFTTPIDSDTDADFRAWGGQISAQLAAVGLTQTADTGQINWTTVSIAGYPGIVGYEIWRFNDAAQSTTPIFFKLEYGASSAEAPQMYLTVGPNSDGAGNITGTLKSNRQIIMQANVTFGQATPSFICYKSASGFLGVALKCGSYSYPTAFIITRTNDTSGNVTADGWGCYSSGQPGSPGLYYAQNPGAGVQLPSNGNFGGGGMTFWPLGLGSSAAGGSIQAVPVYALQPAIQVNAQMCTTINAEVPTGNQFTLNVVGTTPRNFVAIGHVMSNYSTYGYCMIWE